jgi:hypothetical protein
MDPEQVSGQIETLCVRFAENCSESSSMTVDDVRGLFYELFSRFENPPIMYFSINTGWFSIIANLHKKLLFIDPNYTIFQIKEKFGSLRFYATFKNISPIAESIAFDLISVAERSSSFSCEICGRFGTQVEDKCWLSTRCSEHKNLIADF